MKHYAATSRKAIRQMPSHRDDTPNRVRNRVLSNCHSYSDGANNRRLLFISLSSAGYAAERYGAMDFPIQSVPGLLTLTGAVSLLQAQGKSASPDSVRRYLRRRGTPLARVGRSLMIPPESLTGYKHGR